jgi:hypothetical protein
MPFKFSNSASATLTSSITSTSTSLTVASGLGGLFPGLSAGESFTAVLVDSSNNLEIVLVTARTGDLLTIVRAQEGTVARAFSSGSKFEMRLTSAALSNFVQLDGVQTVTGNKTFSGATTFSGSATFSGATTFSSAISGSITGNAGTVTDGVYLSTAQTITGAKTFTGVVRLSGATSMSRQDTSLEGGQVNFERASDAATQYSIDVYGSGTTPSMRFINAQRNVTSLTLDNSGNLTAEADITAFSDERLKTDWQDLGADFVSSLAAAKAGIYKRTDNGETQVGVGAQSLQKFLPQAVHQSGEWLSVAYGNAALASCVMLAREIVAIKAKLEG